MKHVRFRLRLLLLIVALLATCFASINAVRIKVLSDGAVETMNLEAELASRERWLETLRSELKNSTDPNVRGSVSSQIPLAKAQVAALRRQLASKRP